MGQSHKMAAADESVYVLISAIEHYSYCPRQCGLIHMEQTYDDNVYTVRGTLAHERVDQGSDTVVGGVRIKRSVRLWSQRLRIRGKADLVEFRPGGPYPVEYKVGASRTTHAALQLCAQALCLEEMLGADVPCGAIYSHRQRRRREVPITTELRKETIAVIRRIRAMLQAQDLPNVLNDSRCRRCSLNDACLPHVIGEPARIRGLQSVLFQPWHTTSPGD